MNKNSPLLTVVTFIVSMLFCTADEKTTDTVGTYLSYKSLIKHDHGIDITGVSIVANEDRKKDGRYILIDQKYVSSILINQYHEMKAHVKKPLPRRSFSVAEPLQGKLVIVKDGKAEILAEINLQHSCLWPTGIPIPIEILKTYLY